MKMYDLYKHTKLNSDDTLGLGRAIIHSVEKHLPDEGYLNRQCGHVKREIAEAEVLKGRSRVNELTAVIADIDDERDDIKVGMDTEIESKIRLKKFDPEKGEAAEKLKKEFDKTPINTEAGYEVETNQINARLRLLNTPENRNHFTTLDIISVFDRFIEVQEDFDKYSNEKDAIESIKIRGTVKSAVKRIKDRIDYILPYLESQAMDLPAKYEPLAKEVQQIIKRTMAEAQARITLKMNQQKS